MDLIHHRPSLRDIGLAAAGTVLAFGIKPAEPAFAIGQTAPTPREYVQCGGTANGFTYPSNHTVYINEISDPEAGLQYSSQDLGALPGQCGNGQETHTSQALLNMGNKAILARSYLQCGGNNDEVIYPSSHTVTVDEYVTDLSQQVAFGTNGYLTQDLGAYPGQCGNPSSVRLVATCLGDRTWEVIDFEVPAGPWDHSQTELDAYNKANCPTPNGVGIAPSPFLNQYTQCGGEVNGQVIPTSHLIDTTQALDSNGKPVYTIQDLGVVPGHCYSTPQDNSFLIAKGQPIPQDIIDAANNAFKSKAGDINGEEYLPTNILLQCGATAPDGTILYSRRNPVLWTTFTSKSGKTTWGAQKLNEHPYLCGEGSAIPLSVTPEGQTIYPSNIRELMHLAESVSDQEAVNLYNKSLGR